MSAVIVAAIILFTVAIFAVMFIRGNRSKPFKAGSWMDRLTHWYQEFWTKMKVVNVTEESRSNQDPKKGHCETDEYEPWQ